MADEKLEVACPAGTELHPPGQGFSVICGAIERQNRDSGEPVRQHIDALVSGAREPTTIRAYCCASGPLPIERRPEGSASQTGYQHCPVWCAERARLAERRQTISAVDTNYGGVGNRD